MQVIWLGDETTWPQWLISYRSLDDERREIFRFAYPGLAEFADHILSSQRASLHPTSPTTATDDPFAGG